MPNQPERRPNDFSRYDAMTDEELEEILRLDASCPEGNETDVEEILYVMETLAGRNRSKVNTGKTPEEALKIFKEYYMPADDTYEAVRSAELNMGKPKRRWLRPLAGLAAAAAIVIFGSMTAAALGHDIWGPVIQWTRETFHFGQSEESEPVGEDNREMESLQEVLEQNNIFTPLAPTWFPEGYELVDTQAYSSPSQEIYIAFYHSDDKEIRIQIKLYLADDPQQIERSEGYVATYESAGIDYFIFENYDLLKAVWINENYECYISGELTMDEIQSMIDSIGKG